MRTEAGRFGNKKEPAGQEQEGQVRGARENKQKQKIMTLIYENVTKKLQSQTEKLKKILKRTVTNPYTPDRGLK